MTADDLYARVRTARSQFVRFRLQPHERETRKSRAIETIVEREQAIAALGGMSANKEVSQNTARAGRKLFSSARGVLLKSPSGRTPNHFLQIPLDDNTCVPEECIKKNLAASRCGHQLGEDRGGNRQATVSERRVQSRLCRQTESRITVPQRDDHVAVDGCCHLPRVSRSQRLIARRPDGIPGFPIPRYLANGLSILTGRTRTLSSPLSKINPSPDRTPSARRISWGTVICPLLVILACLCNWTPPRVPYSITCFLTKQSETGLGAVSGFFDSRFAKAANRRSE